MKKALGSALIFASLACWSAAASNPVVPQSLEDAAAPLAVVIKAAATVHRGAPRTEPTSTASGLWLAAHAACEVSFNAEQDGGSCNGKTAGQSCTLWGHAGRCADLGSWHGPHQCLCASILSPGFKCGAGTGVSCHEAR